MLLGIPQKLLSFYYIFQREWTGGTDNCARIGCCDTATGEWDFFCYSIKSPESVNGGLTCLGNDEFAVIERDKQGAPDVAIKLWPGFWLVFCVNSGISLATPAPHFFLLMGSLLSAVNLCNSLYFTM